MAGGRRFDIGERDHFISLEMASIGTETMAAWGTAAITQRLLALTERLAHGLLDFGVEVPATRSRAPHILRLSLPDGLPDGLIGALAANGIHVAGRLGRIRISPHLYNDDVDIDRFLAAFTRLMLPNGRK